MTQQFKIGRVATTIASDGEGSTEVVYHSTRVVIFNAELVVLNSGGWYSATTKTRMNQVSNTFHLGYQVFQKRHQWYVEFQGKTYPYSDGMRLDRTDGKVYKYLRCHPHVEEIQPITL